MKKFWKYSAIVFLLLCFFAPSGVVVAGLTTSELNTLTPQQQKQYNALTPDQQKTFTSNFESVGPGTEANTSSDQIFTAMGVTPGNVAATNSSQMTPTQQATYNGLTAAQQNVYNAQIAAHQTPDQALATAQSSSAGVLTSNTSNVCISMTSFSLSTCLYEGLAWVAYTIMGIMSLLLWLAGSGLDWVLNYTIVQMSQNISVMTGINIVWKTIRDLSNIAFIFILLYEAIKLILSRSDTTKIKGIIAGIVITALLINFSMFFTKVIIDASNVLAIGFYQSMVGTSTQTAGGATGVQGSNIAGGGNNYTIPAGLSGPFINDLHVVDFVTMKDPTTNASLQNADYKGIIMVGLGGSILFLVLAFVFFAVSVMFLIRYITLIVLLMSAPIGYLGFGLPMLKSTQSTWWNTLIGQCIFAPLWMFCCWAILSLIAPGSGFITLAGGTTLTQLSQSGAMTSAVTGVGGVAQSGGIILLVNFFLVIALVIGSLTLAKKYAGQGSGYVAQATGKLTAFAGGAVMGGAAMAGRNSIGRAANWAANNEKLKGAAANNVFARGLLKASNRTANSTFDARNTKAVGQTTGALGMNIGKGTKNTLRTVQKAKADKEAKFAETLKPSDAHIAEMKKAPEKRVVENQAAVDERKKKMSDPEFVKKQEEAKRKYLESDEYKNSDVYKKAEAEKVANEAKLKPETEKDLKLGEELKGLEKQRSESMSLSKQKELDDQIKVKKQEIDGQKKKIDEVKKEIAENNTASKTLEKHKDEWRTAEQRNIESEIGSFETAIKEDKKTIEDINGLYATRVKAYADNLEGTQHHMLKYAGAVGGMIGGAALGAPVLATAGAGYLGYRLYTHATNWKGDRQAAADRVRKVAKQETKKERAERTAREYLEEQAEEKKKAGGGEAEKPKAENESGGGEKSKEKTS